MNQNTEIVFPPLRSMDDFILAKSRYFFSFELYYCSILFQTSGSKCLSTRICKSFKIALSATLFTTRPIMPSQLWASLASSPSWILSRWVLVFSPWPSSLVFSTIWMRVKSRWKRWRTSIQHWLCLGRFLLHTSLSIWWVTTGKLIMPHP